MLNFRYKNVVVTILIYVAMIFASIIPSLWLFQSGFVNGHDSQFHCAQIYDLYNSIIEGNLSYLSNELCSGIGMGVRLMYGSLSHFFVVGIHLILGLFGLSLTASFKFAIYLSILGSMIFSYKLFYKMTGNRIAGIFGGLFFIYFPYRYTNIYIRNAFAEVMALPLIPLVFLSLYNILKLKKFRFTPFILFSISVAMLSLTHNITFLYTVIFAVVFAMFYIKDIIYLLKQKWAYLGAGISIVLILCLIAPVYIPMLEHMSLGLHRIFNPEDMRTSKDIVMAEIDRSALFCMLVANENMVDYIFPTVVSIILFITGYEITVLLYKNPKLKENKYLNLLYLLPLALIVVGIVYTILLLNIAGALFVLLSLVILFITKVIDRKKDGTKFELKGLLALILLTVVVIILVNSKWIWSVLPQFMLKIQFPWRLYSFMAFFIAGLLAIVSSIVLKYINNNYINAIFLMASGWAIILVAPIDNNYVNMESDKGINESWCNSIYSCGWQLEYFYKDFYNGSKNTFWWKVYDKLRDENNNEQIDFCYVVDGTYSNYKLEDGIITFDIVAKDECFCEVARVYYLGYEVTLTTEDEVIELNPYMFEGYVGFDIPKGATGTVKVEYKGTTLMNLSWPLFYLGIASIVGLLGYEGYKSYKNKRSNKTDVTEAEISE